MCVCVNIYMYVCVLTLYRDHAPLHIVNANIYI